MAETPTSDHFAPLHGADFIVLTTYRKSGEPVPTTVWFAEADGVLYITTNGQAGKVKRLRANPAVLAAPSDQVGNVAGPAVGGRARLLAPEEYGPALAALQAKYGERFTQVVARMDADRPAGSRVYLAVTP